MWELAFDNSQILYNLVNINSWCSIINVYNVSLAYSELQLFGFIISWHNQPQTITYWTVVFIRSFCSCPHGNCRQLVMLTVGELPFGKLWRQHSIITSLHKTWRVMEARWGSSWWSTMTWLLLSQVMNSPFSNLEATNEIRLWVS